MSARDRTITLALVVSALAGWVVLTVVFVAVSPEGDAGAQLLGALVLGAAVGLTVWPILWSLSRGHPGGLVSSGRRSALAGLVVTILVVLRAIDVVTLPVVLFIVAGAVLVEIGISLRR